MQERNIAGLFKSNERREEVKAVKTSIAINIRLLKFN